MTTSPENINMYSGGEKGGICQRSEHSTPINLTMSASAPWAFYLGMTENAH